MKLELDRILGLVLSLVGDDAGLEIRKSPLVATRVDQFLRKGVCFFFIKYEENMKLHLAGPTVIPGKYYIATMALITASTALTIMVMNIHFCGAEARPVPRWAKVVILKYMSRILFVYDVGESCLSPRRSQEPEQITKVYSTLPGSNLKSSRHKDLSRKKERGKLLKNDLGCQGGTPQNTDSSCARYEGLTRNIEYIAKCLKDHRATTSKGSEWKKVAKVIDRFFMWVFFAMVFVMTILIIARAD